MLGDSQMRAAPPAAQVVTRGRKVLGGSGRASVVEQGRFTLAA
jgi:hypothetical protein